MSRPAQRRRTARERILEAADELFYTEGIHTVGIDKVIERAGVAKGSLYYSFAGKDDLVREYLANRHGMWAERVAAGIGRHVDPRERILAVFDVLGALFAEPEYRGCTFVNAAAEATGDSVEARAATAFRDWVHALFRGLVRAAGASRPKQLADSLVVLYDGAVVTAQMDKSPAAARTARRMAAMLLDDAGVPAASSD